MAKPKTKDPRVTLFDEIILSKRNRGRTSLFSSRVVTDFLSDTSEHLWRSAAASSYPPNSRSRLSTSDDLRSIITRGKSSYFSSLDIICTPV